MLTIMNNCSNSAQLIFMFFTFPMQDKRHAEKYVDQVVVHGSLLLSYHYCYSDSLDSVHLIYGSQVREGG